MKYVIEKLPSYALIKIEEKKVDSRISPELKQLFILMNTEGIKNLILDLSTTEYIDSSGLSSILVANRLCNNANGYLVLTGLNPNVYKMFEISQLADKLNIADSIDDAIEAIHYAEIESFDENFDLNDLDDDFENDDLNEEFDMDYENDEFYNDEYFDEIGLEDEYQKDNY
jgi:anti-sigma B factor antagonist